MSTTEATTNRAGALAVKARHLQITTADQEVFWEESGDLSLAMKVAAEHLHITLPATAEGGVVVVGLDMDGGGAHEVYTNTGLNLGFRTSVEVIEQAIAALTVARDGIVAAQRPAGVGR